jgi:hypothetical protein
MMVRPEMLENCELDELKKRFAELMREADRAKEQDDG